MPDVGHSPTGTGGVGRAIAAPVRAVSRIFSTGAGRGGGSANPARRAGGAVVDCAVYIGGARLASDWDRASGWDYAHAVATARERQDAHMAASAEDSPNPFVWLDLREPGPEELEGIAETFQLDEFAAEDAIKGGQRPKIEQYGEMTFLVLRTARYVEHAELTETSEIVETGDLMIFVGRGFVVTVQHGELTPLGPVRVELEGKPELLSLGPWAAVYGIIDRIVDSYLDVSGMIEEDIDAVEAHVFSRQVSGRIARIYQLKRELVEFKRAVLPLQRPLGSLLEGRPGAVPAEVLRYFRDVHDHLVRTVEKVVSYDELINSILQARLAQVTVEQNNDMRKIASWAAIAAMQTAIAGVYGMNFRFMPETRWQYGYPVILMLMFASAIALYRLFRRSGWL